MLKNGADMLTNIIFKIKVEHCRKVVLRSKLAGMSSN